MSDLIRRTDAIKALYKAWGCGWIEAKCEWIAEACKQTLDALPTVERERGGWIDEADKYDASFGIHDYRCSNCNSYADEYIGGHEWYTAGKPNFCPCCGADMREREGE